MSDKPIFAIVGRPNVGKSTLFNRLTRSRAALVADFPGLTRDRHYGEAFMHDRSFFVVDTGGFEPVNADGITREMARQTQQAIDEADLVIFVTDTREGLTGRDHEIAQLLRRTGKPALLAVNKAEGMLRERAGAEFHELALGDPYIISSAHGDGIGNLLEDALAHFPLPKKDEPVADEYGDFPEDFDEAALDGADAAEAPAVEEDKNVRIKIAIVGRPNVGKSTLVNAVLGEERVIAFDEPGTTRDSIYLDFDRAGRPYTIIDTAGIRRRGKVTEAIEKFSVIKTLQAIDDANVAVLMLDALQGITDQDAQVAGFVLEQGRALVVAINKWEAADTDTREKLKVDYERKLYFLDFATVLYISAKGGSGMNMLLPTIRAAYSSATRKMATPKLTRVLQLAAQQQQPPRHGAVRPKMRYAHQGGQNPPLIVIHGTSLDKITDHYKRYLEHFFRKAFELAGTPLRIDFRVGHNPFADEAARRSRR
jgi:GTPase